jgi:hypothetical protein
VSVRPTVRADKNMKIEIHGRVIRLPVTQSVAPSGANLTLTTRP